MDQSSNRPKLLKLTHINSRSFINKIAPFQQLITDEDINASVIAETWIKSEDDFTPKQIPPPHYDILSFPHLNGRQGEGMALVNKDHHQINDNNANIKSTYEYQDYTVGISKECRLNIHRYPSTSGINFCDIFPDMLETNIVKDRGELISIGDFNIHMDSMKHPDTIIYNNCLDSLNLTNLVDFPIHKALHTLDLIICDRQT